MLDLKETIQKMCSFRRASGFKNKFLSSPIYIKRTYSEKNTKNNINSSSSSSSSSSDSSSDLDKKTEKNEVSAAKASREESLNKLKNLLKKIVEVRDTSRS